MTEVHGLGSTPSNISGGIPQRSRDEVSIAQLIIKQKIENRVNRLGGSTDDIEHVRDPNLLAALILMFSPHYQDKDQRNKFCSEVLRLVLAHDKVNQEHYFGEYYSALMNAINYFDQVSGDRMSAIVSGIPNSRIWRPFDPSSLSTSLLVLGEIWRSGVTCTLPLDRIQLTDYGHGVLATHEAEKERLEAQGLRNAGEIINELLLAGMRMDEEHLGIIHAVIAGNTSAYDAFRDRKRPINLGYRNMNAFRDLMLYPPFIRSPVDRDLMERYGLGDLDLKREVAPELEAPPTTKPQGEIPDLVSFIAAREKLAASPKGKSLVEGTEGLIELKHLMRKYFIWFNQVIDNLDAVYFSCGVLEHGQKPLFNGVEHPALFFSAMAFNRFMNIHPFENGNTRTDSYAIANYLLSRYGYPPFLLTSKNQKTFFNIQRFGRFNTDIFWDTHSTDVSDWDKTQNVDEELAAFFAREIQPSLN